MHWCQNAAPALRCTIILAVTVCAAVQHAQAVTIDTVPVGNPGNAPDTRYFSISVGSVAYAYQIGKYEVTAGEYTEFLNAVAKADPNGLYNTSMDVTVDSFGANIQRTGSSPNFSYSVAADWANRPVNFVSFWDSARFANWLHNGQPTGPQGPETTEDGAYHDIGNQTLFGRNAGARFFIPTEDEWYKAAYHDESAGLVASYFDYPTGTNAAPGNDINETTNPGNNANRVILPNNYAIGGPYGRTIAGEFELSDGPYGTFDQGGNVEEWNETLLFGSRRGYRGGSLNSSSGPLSAPNRGNDFPTSENGRRGFRVASIPEPSTLLLTTLAGWALLWRRRRLVHASVLAAAVGIALGLTPSSPAMAQDFYPDFALVVQLPSYEAFLTNIGGAPIRVDGYAVTSASGSLNPAGWAPLDSAGPEIVAALGPGADGFLTANPSPTSLAELNPLGSATWPAGQSWSLGFPFASNAPNFVLDAVFRFSSPDGFVLTGGTVIAPGDLGRAAILVIPEPSSLLLGALASIWLLRRRRGLVCASILGAIVCSATSARAITIDTAPVGNVGNANDPATGGVYGGVDHVYRIGTTEVTVGQYTEFLNAVADTDAYALYNASMATDLTIAGISQEGLSGSYMYSVIGSANKPVTKVSWGDAARFANWLHNNQPTGPQDASTTERGAYTLDGATTSAALAAVTRNAGAQWFLPTENEWYKAAYHKNDGVTGNYWDYPTSTDSQPYSDQPPGEPSNQANVANFFNDDGVVNGYDDGFAVTGSTSTNSSQNYLTDAGAYTSSMSPYGTFDQGGNVYEWNEAAIGSTRRLRGGSWPSGLGSLRSMYWRTVNPTPEGGRDIGFRVATVPEPSSILLLGCAAGAAIVIRGRVQRARWFLSAGMVAFLAAAPAAAHAATVRTVALSGQSAPGTPSGVNFNSFPSFGPVLNDAGQTAFYAHLAGSGVDSTNFQGVWSEGSGSLALVARMGDHAPGTPSGVNYGIVYPPVLNDAGQTMFTAKLTGSGVDPYNDRGIWLESSGSLALVARAGDHAPGTPSGGIYNQIAITNRVLNNAGQTAFLASATGSGGSLGIWSGGSGSLALVARGGSQAPGMPSGVNFFDFLQNTIPLNDAGQSAFVAYLSDSTYSIWSEGSGSLALVARSGDQTPGMPSGVNYSSFPSVSPALNNAGQTAFVGRLTGSGVDSTNNQGIWSEGSGSLALVARQGDHAPGTPSDVNFSHWGFQLPPVLNNAGQTAFYATLTGSGVDSTNDAGIWMEHSGSLMLVARSGDHATDGTPIGIISINSTIVLNDAGQIAFSGGGTIWATDRGGALESIARAGELLEVASGDFRTISGLRFGAPSAEIGNSDGRASAFNNLGQLAFAATFTDGSSGVFVSNRVAIPEPSSLLLAALAAAALLKTRRSLR